MLKVNCINNLVIIDIFNAVLQINYRVIKK